jgi:hypothetical protein
MMRVSFERLHDGIRFTTFCEEADKSKSPKFGSHRDFQYRSSNGAEFPDTHPDRLALVALLNTLPFAGERLHIGWPVSERFLEAVQLISRVEVVSEKGTQAPIGRATSSRHALSFSGGADSVATLAVMPPATEPVFMLRSQRNKRTLYDSDAALESCRKLKAMGYVVHIVESDFEYLRDPVGFPTDLSVATPAILLAESRGFESIAFGTILESAYGTSGKAYRNYVDSSHFRLWSRMFDAVGLGYSLPVAGVSEVGSSLICQEMPLGRFHQSCIRGKWGKPCKNCWKCFRKSILSAALKGETLPSATGEMMRSSKEVRKHLLEDKPIKHEGVLTYSLERAGGGDDAVRELRSLTRVGSQQTGWMERWYPRSAELIDEKYREFTSNRLTATLGVMTQEQSGHLEAWSNPNDEQREERLAAFVGSLGS